MTIHNYSLCAVLYSGIISMAAIIPLEHKLYNMHKRVIMTMSDDYPDLTGRVSETYCQVCKRYAIVHTDIMFKACMTQFKEIIKQTRKKIDRGENVGMALAMYVVKNRSDMEMRESEERIEEMRKKYGNY